MDHTHHHTDPQQSYTCPMHPEVIKPGPGKCPICGMDLVTVEPPNNKDQSDHQHEHQHHQAAVKNAHPGHEEHIAHDKHAAHHTHDFLKRFWICLVITVSDIIIVAHDSAMAGF